MKWPKTVPKHFMAFLRTLVNARPIQVRIMCICCCPVQIFIINLRLFTVIAKILEVASYSNLKQLQG